MNIINLFANHKLAASLTMVIMILAGVLALQTLSIGLNPVETVDRVGISIVWRGASAEDVEKLVTNPLEHQLRGLDNVKTVRSTTKDAQSYVQVRLQPGSDVQKAADDIKQRISQIQSFPVDIEPVQVRIEEYKDEVASVLIKSDGGIDELLPRVREMEADLLNRGAHAIDFQGTLPKREIAIQVPSKTLFEMGTSFEDLAGELSQLSQDAPAGTVGRGQMSRQIRSLDQRRDTAEFEDLPIMASDGDRLVRLGDIATVETRPVVDQPLSTVDGEPAIQMVVMMNAGSDSMNAAAMLTDWVEQTRETLPDGMTLTLFVEVWKFIQDEINMIVENGLTGLVLVIIALLVFLQFRVAMWVMIGMPITFLAALLGFYYLGGTLNVLSLIAIVMALGIVVDDAIVVGEDAVTQFQQGKSPADAAVSGARRMFSPVMASSLTTLCAFLPLLLRAGEEPIAEIPLMLLCVIVASLIECFLVLPGHLRTAFEKSAGKEPPRFNRWFNTKFDDFRENRFRPLVRLAMNNRRIVIGGAFSMFALMLTLWITGWIKTDMSLSINFDQVNADIQFVSGTTDAEKKQYLGQLEAQLRATDEAFGGGNIVTHIINHNIANINNEQKVGSQYARVWAELISPEQREVTAAEFASDWLDRVEPSYVVDSITIQRNTRFWGDFSILLKDAESDVLKAAAGELIEELSTLDGVTNVHDDLPWGKEQWIFELTTEGRALGLTTASVGRQLRAAYDGRRIQIFQQDDNEMEVRLILPEHERTDLASLGQFPIKTPAGDMVPLQTVASWEGKRGLDIIRHHNAVKTITVSGNVDVNTITGGEVVEYFDNNIKERLQQKYNIDSGLDGSSLAEEEANANFLTRFAIALALIYIVLAWVFSSYTWPLAVMAAIPFGLTGALLGHLAMGMVINPMSLLGLYTLTGIVINDSIILVSTYRNLVAEGEPRLQAIEDAVCMRLRAVILTSLTTFAGLFPLMLEESPMASAFTPLAASVCFGMLYGTILVLLVVPALLSSVITINEWVANRAKGNRNHEGRIQQTA